MFTKKAAYVLHQASTNSAADTVSGANIFLHPPQGMISDDYLTGNPAFLVPIGGFNGDPFPSASSRLQKQVVKKDRHSKIYTSQGPRDRRVRLSIGIARKFFDLQEMLGFDKPSKTMDWLLTKSKSAIKDLQADQTNNGQSGRSLSSSDPSKVDSPGNSKSASHPDCCVEEHRGGTAAVNLEKESRVKARARARERTREKMLKNFGCDQVSPVPSAGAGQIHEVCRIPSGDCRRNSSSIMRTKGKNYPPAWGFQPRDLGAPNCWFSASDQNWDVCSFASSQSNFFPSLDQPKFSNSNNANN